MGSSSSKQANGSKTKATTDGNTGRAESPKDKHNSADSQAPLAEHAATVAYPRTSSLERNRSIAASEIGLHHAYCNSVEDQIQSAPRTSSVASPPTNPASETQPSIEADDLEGHSNVTHPPPPPRLLHLSELIDPAELPLDCHIRSPSGTLLAPEQFLVHPHRPRSIRERQEEIKEKVRAASSLGFIAEKDEYEMSEKNAKRNGAEGSGEKKMKHGFRGCWCFASS